MKTLLTTEHLDLNKSIKIIDGDFETVICTKKELASYATNLVLSNINFVEKSSTFQVDGECANLELIRDIVSNPSDSTIDTIFDLFDVEVSVIVLTASTAVIVKDTITKMLLELTWSHNDEPLHDINSLKNLNLKELFNILLEDCYSLDLKMDSTSNYEDSKSLISECNLEISIADII